MNINKGHLPECPRADKLIQQALQVGKAPTARTLSPTSKLDVVASHMGLPAQFKTCRTGRRKDPAKIILLIDSSGSMSRTQGITTSLGQKLDAHQAGVSLAISLRRAELAGLCQLVVGFTSHHGAVLIQRFSDDPSDPDSAMANASFTNGSEGIADAIEELEANGMLTPDVTLVCFTDSEIYDAPPKISELMAKGIYCIGCYTGNEGSMLNVNEMNRHFPEFVWGNTTERTADKVGKLLKRAAVGLN